MKYGIGIDVGIASVGFAVVGLSDGEEPCGILRTGSRIFKKAEHPKTGESLAAPRREARSARRRLRRHKHRLERIKGLIVSKNILSTDELASLYAGKLEDIYSLRTFALDNPISSTEFARILIHLAQRRGFKSNRKSDALDKEQGKLLSAVSQNKSRMESEQYRTVGEMMHKSDAFSEYKRNKAEDYSSTVHRDMIASEASLIFKTQRELGNAFANEEIQAEYLSILLSQRSFDEGPGGNSPYGGNMIEKMVGICTFKETDEDGTLAKRGAKAAFTCEYSTLLQKVNQISILCNGVSQFLNKQQREIVIQLALQTPELTYGKIRKALVDMPEQATFNMLRYRADKSVEETEKQKLNVCKAYHEIRKALDKFKKSRIKDLTHDQLDVIGTAFSLYKTDEKILAALAPANLTSFDTNALLNMSTSPFAKFGQLSIKAMRKINPFLEQGMKYDQACTAAGYDFKGHTGQEKSTLLPANSEDLENVTNPVVRRAISQTIKVVNAIIREQSDSPSYINIELAREMSKDFMERKQLDKSMEDNAAQNQRLMEELRTSLKILSPTGQDLVKYRLWKEQDGRCAYSLSPIPIDTLFDAGSADIDHIIPYSICFDDSRRNKVLVLAHENRQKGNRLPLEYLQGKRAEDFTVWVQNNVHQYGKRQNLLKTKITEDDKNKFMERNLTDTKYMSRFLYNFITDHLQFAPSSTGKKRRVTSVNGIITSHLRKRWGLSKVRADGDKHHALDAIVIACATQKLINEISGYYGRQEIKYLQQADSDATLNPRTGERFPQPWPYFSDDVQARLGDNPAERLVLLENAGKLTSYSQLPMVDLSKVLPIFVSQAPNHKVTGAAHKETIKGKVANSSNYVTFKRPLTSLKLDKDGELENYFMPSSDTLLYAALKKQLLLHGGNAEKAFSAPFYKPKSDGTQGPLVRKVKLVEKFSLNVNLHGNTACADNDSMVRIDVFYVKGDGYYFVPIYVADTIKAELPSKAVVAGGYAKWKEMLPENFIFSLYSGDLIFVEGKKDMTLNNKNKDSTKEKTISCRSAFLYYVGANIFTASIIASSHDRCYGIESMGIKTLKSLEKYQVDTLGNISKAGKEPRKTFR